jgi:hypothetical protein
MHRRLRVRTPSPIAPRPAKVVALEVRRRTRTEQQRSSA